MKTLILYNEKAYVELSPERPYCFDENLNPDDNGTITPASIGQSRTVKSCLLDNIIRRYSTIHIADIRIGTAPECHLMINQEEPFLCILSGMRLHLYEGILYLNGRRIENGCHDLQIGDTLFNGKIKLTAAPGIITCTGTGYEPRLNPPLNEPVNIDGFPIYKRSPRIIKRLPSEQVEIQKPASREEKKKGQVFKRIIPPLCTLCITVATSILMKRGLFVLISAGSMIVTIVFSVVSLRQDNKDRKEQEIKRVKNYEEYLLRTRRRLQELYNHQTEALTYHYPEVKDIEALTEQYSSRIYERSADEGDFLTISLGRSDMEPSYRVNFQEDMEMAGQDTLYEEGRAAAEEYRMVKQVPAVIDLKRAHLGLVGEKAHIHRVLKAIIPQICFLQSYHDVEIIMYIEAEDEKAFSWMTWYPHCRIKAINVNGLVSMENHNEQILASMTQILKARRQTQEEGKKDTFFLPYYIFIIDNPKLVINNSIMEYLQSSHHDLGFSIIYSTSQQANLPENIKTIVLVEGMEYATLLMNEGHLLNQVITLQDTDSCDLERMARKLAALQHSKGISNRIPDSITFFDMYHVMYPEELPVARLWQENCCYKSLAVPLGVRAVDDIVYLNLHEKAHGPHGLIAGTTGSGKSEILQSYILSLAVNFHPHEVGFLLIDYKGGGMANLFRRLPHLLGTITNLDGSESMRALASIKSELARRQRIFNECDVNNINDYTKLFKSGKAHQPLPHLLLISDEFAELKHEQPEFMAELVSTARIGRSLGVHLILATQKPSGVVDDQIWSNSKFKLALKVQNESDSNEVLKTPDAARITQAGRAYLQVGNNEIYELFQSAWSGADYSEETAEKGFDDRIYEISRLGQKSLINADLSQTKEQHDVKQTQLDAVVNYIADIYSQMDASPVEKPWLPSLGTKLVTPHIRTEINVGQIEGCHLAAAIGMVDIPEEQKQEEYIHDFAEDGNLAVFSSAGFGKSTVILSLALTLASSNSPEILNYYILDLGNSSLIQLKGLPHTADYLAFDDMEKMNKLIKRLNEEMKRRKLLFARTSSINFRIYNEVAEEKLPAVIIFIDNYDVVRELETDMEAFITKLTRDGIGIGIYTVITASRTNAVRYAVLNNFKNKLALFLFDTSEAHGIVGRSSYQLPEVKGRALVKLAQVSVMQCYLPADGEDLAYAANIAAIVNGITDLNTADPAEGIRILPEIVTYQELLHKKRAPFLAAIGLDAEDVLPQTLELFGNVHLIIGGPQTGKTNLLRIIYKQIQGAKLFISDSRSGDLQEYESDPAVVYCAEENNMVNFMQALQDEATARRTEFEQNGKGMRLKEYCRSSLPVSAIIIDDADYFIDMCKIYKSDMEKLLQAVLEVGMSVIATTIPSKLRGYDDLTKQLKDSQSGVVLGHPDDQSIFKISAPRHYKPQMEFGYWYQRGIFKQIKIPVV